MNSYKYLIIGGGMTADAAVRGIRKIDADGSIGMVSMEKDPPYNRPPLTKGLWKGKPFDSIWRKTQEKENVTLHLGRTIVYLDADNQTARDDQGNEYHGDKILLATGGTPRHLPFGGEDILYFRTAEDFRHLHQKSQQATEFAVIGGGFIGSEIAAALAMNGKKVTMLFPEEGIGATVYPKDLSQYITDYYRQKGVEVLAGEEVSDLSSSNNQYIVHTPGGKKVPANKVVAGIGIIPNVDLAKAAGLQVEKGIVVDEQLRTNNPNIYAAGDVAEFYNPLLDKRLRVEHEDNANSMGMHAGRNMAGESTPYHYLPYFYSDLFELGYEAVGELNPRLETVADWADEFKKGIVYYLQDGRVRGVLLWNVWEKLEAARELIAQPGPMRAEDLQAWKIAY